VAVTTLCPGAVRPPSERQDAKQNGLSMLLGAAPRCDTGEGGQREPHHADHEVDADEPVRELRRTTVAPSSA
jgi:hypothetical protein